MSFTRFVLSGTLAALIAAPAVADQWRGWNIHPEDYPDSIALETFAAEVAEKTEGRIEPTVYHNAVLGDQPDAIEQVHNGGLDFANFNMGQIVPATNVLSLPFIFSDVDQMHTVMDGEISQRFSDALAAECLVAAAVTAAKEQRTLWAEREKASRAKVEAAGALINEVQDPKAFQDAMAPVYAGFIEANPDLEVLITDIQSAD